MIRKLTAVCLAISVAFSGLMVDGMAETKKKPRGPSLPLIRDAEIEGLLRLYSKPIFKAAGLNPSAVRVYIINNDKINAFVAGGPAPVHSHRAADAHQNARTRSSAFWPMKRATLPAAIWPAWALNSAGPACKTLSAP